MGAACAQQAVGAGSRSGRERDADTCRFAGPAAELPRPPPRFSLRIDAPRGGSAGAADLSSARPARSGRGAGGLDEASGKRGAAGRAALPGGPHSVRTVAMTALLPRGGGRRGGGRCPARRPSPTPPRWRRSVTRLVTWVARAPHRLLAPPLPSRQARAPPGPPSVVPRPGACRRVLKGPHPAPAPRRRQPRPARPEPWVTKRHRKQRRRRRGGGRPAGREGVWGGGGQARARRRRTKSGGRRRGRRSGSRSAAPAGGAGRSGGRGERLRERGGGGRRPSDDPPSPAGAPAPGRRGGARGRLCYCFCLAPSTWPRSGRS